MATNQPEIVTIYEAVIDLGERGPSKSLGFFATKEDALYIGRGAGWYGGNGWTNDHKAIKVGNQYYILSRTEPVMLQKEYEARVEAARAKLSPEEIKLLGL